MIINIHFVVCSKHSRFQIQKGKHLIFYSKIIAVLRHKKHMKQIVWAEHRIVHGVAVGTYVKKLLKFEG